MKKQKLLTIADVQQLDKRFDELKERNRTLYFTQDQVKQCILEGETVDYDKMTINGLKFDFFEPLK
jgi:hypothetical protein